MTKSFENFIYWPLNYNICLQAFYSNWFSWIFQSHWFFRLVNKWISLTLIYCENRFGRSLFSNKWPIIEWLIIYNDCAMIYCKPLTSYRNKYNIWANKFLDFKINFLDNIISRVSGSPLWYREEALGLWPKGQWFEPRYRQFEKVANLDENSWTPTKS